MPLQLVVRRRPRLKIFFRELPPTYFIPRDAQIHMRIKFAEAAKKAKGKKGLCPCHGLPWAAHYVKEALEGKQAPEELKVRRIPPHLREYYRILDAIKFAQKLREILVEAKAY